jgi:hypothetical protein
MLNNIYHQLVHHAVLDIPNQLRIHRNDVDVENYMTIRAYHIESIRRRVYVYQ